MDRGYAVIPLGPNVEAWYNTEAPVHAIFMPGLEHEGAPPATMGYDDVQREKKPPEKRQLKCESTQAPTTHKNPRQLPKNRGDAVVYSQSSPYLIHASFLL